MWISDILASVERMKEVEKRVFKIMMGGAVGALIHQGKLEEKFRIE